jgi:transposase
LQLLTAAVEVDHIRILTAAIGGHLHLHPTLSTPIAFALLRAAHAHVRRGYAPVGHTPVLTCSGEKQRVSVISCLTISPQAHDVGLYFRLLDPNQNVCGPDIVAFLRTLRRSLPRMLVVWDGASIHARSAVVREFLAGQRAIAEETLPAYAPELNPDEFVWSYLKHSRLYHFAPTNVIDLYDRLEQELETLSLRSDTLRGFVNHSDLILSV